MSLKVFGCSKHPTQNIPSSTGSHQYVNRTSKNQTTFLGQNSPKTDYAHLHKCFQFEICYSVFSRSMSHVSFWLLLRFTLFSSMVQRFVFRRCSQCELLLGRLALNCGESLIPVRSKANKSQLTFSRCII